MITHWYAVGSPVCTACITFERAETIASWEATSPHTHILSLSLSLSRALLLF
jgi:hypothetical protein